jgi:hypothetical protein
VQQQDVLGSTIAHPGCLGIGWILGQAGGKTPAASKIMYTKFLFCLLSLCVYLLLTAWVCTRTPTLMYSGVLRPEYSKYRSMYSEYSEYSGVGFRSALDRSRIRPAHKFTKVAQRRLRSIFGFCLLQFFIHCTRGHFSTPYMVETVQNGSQNIKFQATN